MCNCTMFHQCPVKMLTILSASSVLYAAIIKTTLISLLLRVMAFIYQVQTAASAANWLSVGIVLVTSNTIIGESSEKMITNICKIVLR